ncbi:hypothetical protein Pla52o_55030 [Novipirellula galeiformis]|uniref:Uncharacterized protein n=1 Tax=Novipirellula galeiformis TaxID=2528004 RepID=A0A5C6C1S6_9BACT|nr:hypothetical protein Pla52o_55030 [Novipirellula galeiformis]
MFWYGHQFLSANGEDQRVAGIDIDLTKKRTTATPLHPMVLLFLPLVFDQPHNFVVQS